MKNILGTTESICKELFIAPLYKSYFYSQWVQWVEGQYTVKHDVIHSTTTTYNQVWEDVTAGSQAF